MSEPREAWKEVAGKAEALGLKLKLHLEQEHAAAEPTEPEAEETHGTDSGDAKAVIEDIGHKLQEAFDSIGNAAKDPAVHEDVKDMGRLLVDAISTTFSAVGAEVNARTSGGSASEEVADDADEPADGVHGDEIEGGDG